MCSKARDREKTSVEKSRKRYVEENGEMLARYKKKVITCIAVGRKIHVRGKRDF
jgi:hypothetical protein